MGTQVGFAIPKEWVAVLARGMTNCVEAAAIVSAREGLAPSTCEEMEAMHRFLHVLLAIGESIAKSPEPLKMMVTTIPVTVQDGQQILMPRVVGK